MTQHPFAEAGMNAPGWRSNGVDGFGTYCIDSVRLPQDLQSSTVEACRSLLTETTVIDTFGSRTAEWQINLIYTRITDYTDTQKTTKRAVMTCTVTSIIDFSCVRGGFAPARLSSNIPTR